MLSGIAVQLEQKLGLTGYAGDFNVNQPAQDRGIGVHSMEERLRVLGGRLEVKSHRMQGTRIDAWLPIKVGSQQAS